MSAKFTIRDVDCVSGVLGVIGCVIPLSSGCTIVTLDAGWIPSGGIVLYTVGISTFCGADCMPEFGCSLFLHMKK